MKTFFRELQKRHVVKVAIAYLVAAWLVLQLADVIFPALGLPDWSITLVLALLAVGFPAAVILAWVFDLGPGGIRRTDADGDRAASDERQESAASSSQQPAGTEAAPERSIAVLPFPDLSAERDQEHFCDGLTEELLNVLTGIRGLRVASRTSCFAFKGKDADIRKVAEKLQVAHVLEGSVRKAGNRLRITAQLIETSTDSHLWSETYDRELDDIFAIQDDISAHILGALKLQLGGAEANRTTTNSRAWECFLRGRGYAITKSSDDLGRAMTLFRNAVELDPGFVRAWIELAQSAAFLALHHDGGERASEIAERAAAECLRLAPERADCYLARGMARMALQQYDEAKADLLKAAALNEESGEVHYYLGRLAHLQDRPDEAREQYTRAAELDDDDWESPLLALQWYHDAGDEEGERHIAALGIGRVERYLENTPDNPRAYYLGCSALWTLGQTDRARRWAERALELSPNDRSTRYNLACFFAVIGDAERALDLLENSNSSRVWVENDSELDSLRDHPRYRQIIESMPE